MKQSFTKSIPIILLIATISFTLGWYMKSSGASEKWDPDLINFYSNGEQTRLTKIENPQLFNRVLSLIVFVKGDMMSGGNSPLSERDINEMKKSAVEYVYNKPIPIQIKNVDGKIEKIQFTSILFPIDEKWNGAAYIRTTDSTYLYLTSRPSLDFMLRHM